MQFFNIRVNNNHLHNIQQYLLSSQRNNLKDNTLYYLYFNDDKYYITDKQLIKTNYKFLLQFNINN